MENKTQRRKQCARFSTAKEGNILLDFVTETWGMKMADWDWVRIAATLNSHGHWKLWQAGDRIWQKRILKIVAYKRNNNSPDVARTRDEMKKILKRYWRDTQEPREVMAERLSVTPTELSGLINGYLAWKHKQVAIVVQLVGLKSIRRVMLGVPCSVVLHECYNAEKHKVDARVKADLAQEDRAPQSQMVLSKVETVPEPDHSSVEIKIGKTFNADHKTHRMVCEHIFWLYKTGRAIDAKTFAAFGQVLTAVHVTNDPFEEVRKKMAQVQFEKSMK